MDLEQTIIGLATSDNIASIPFWATLAFFFAAMFRAISIRPKSARQDDRLFIWLGIGWLASMALSAALVGFIIMAGLAEPAKRLVMSSSVGYVLIFMGLALFVLKRLHLFAYGLIEAAAAFGVIFSLAITEQDLRTRVTAGLTATYFLVRGLDNLTKSKLLRARIKKWGLGEDL